MSLDQFFTAPETADRFVEWALAPVANRRLRVLEPSAGDLRLANRVPCVHYVDAFEIDPSLKAIPKANVNVAHCDFLELDVARKYDLAIMNPPYSGDRDVLHVAKAATVATRVCALVRLVFLTGVGRYELLHSGVHYHRIAFFSRRPRFDYGPDEIAKRSREGLSVESGSARHDFAAIDLSIDTRPRPLPERTLIEWL